MQLRSKIIEMHLARRSLMAAAAFLSLSCIAGSAEEPKPAAAAPKPKITISKETTYITEPLRPDGYPDYVAALNKRMSEGVTPENNAAVLLQQAFGANEIPKELRENYFRQLGIDPLPEKGDYLIDRYTMIKLWHETHPIPPGQEDDADELDAQFDRAIERPWKSDDFPIVAEWLKRNEKPLALVLKAGERPKCYFPVLCRDDSPLIASLFPHFQQMREAAFALGVRSMLLVQEEKPDEAWRQLLACHRLARCLGASESCLIGLLVGYAIDGVAIAGDARLLHYAAPSAEAVSKMRRDIHALPPLASLSKTLDHGERFCFLDAVQKIAQQGPEMLTGLNPAPKQSNETVKQQHSFQRMKWNLVSGNIDWDVPLEMGNEWYDRFVKIGRESGPRQMRKDLDAANDELKKAARQNRGGLTDMLTLALSRPERSRRIGDLLIGLMLPAISAVYISEQRLAVSGEMLDVALALSAYRTDNGKYPKMLDALVPKYLPKIPDDIFAEKPAPIRYRQERDAYVIWSVGNDGIDNDARSYDDDPPEDDLVLRPVSKEKKKDK